MCCWPRGDELEFLAVKPCRHEAYEAVPKKKVDLDLNICEKKLVHAGYIVVSNVGMMLTVKNSDLEITLYPHGRLLMYPMNDRGLAEKTAHEFYTAIEL